MLAGTRTCTCTPANRRCLPANARKHPRTLVTCTAAGPRPQPRACMQVWAHVGALRACSRARSMPRCQPRGARCTRSLAHATWHTCQHATAAVPERPRSADMPCTACRSGCALSGRVMVAGIREQKARSWRPSNEGPTRGGGCHRPRRPKWGATRNVGSSSPSRSTSLQCRQQQRPPMRARALPTHTTPTRARARPNPTGHSREL